MGEGRGVLAGLVGVGLVLACHLPLRWAGRSQGWTCHLNRRDCPEGTARSAFSTGGEPRGGRGVCLGSNPHPGQPPALRSPDRFSLIDVMLHVIHYACYKMCIKGCRQFTQKPCFLSAPQGIIW